MDIHEYTIYLNLIYSILYLYSKKDRLLYDRLAPFRQQFDLPFLSAVLLLNISNYAHWVAFPVVVKVRNQNEFWILLLYTKENPQFRQALV